MRQEVYHVGRRVQCDLCPQEWTDRTESGGVYFRGHAVCPDCAPEFEAHVAHVEGERLSSIEHCPPMKSFADWVRDDIRQGDDRTIITHLDEEAA